MDGGEKKKPEIINYYNATKGAVDTLDEMVGTYRCKRKVLRWPLAVFENMLDISAVNALVIFLHLNPYWKYVQKKYRRRLFLIEVGKSLVQPYIEIRKRFPREGMLRIWYVTFVAYRVIVHHQRHQRVQLVQFHLRYLASMI